MSLSKINRNSRPAEELSQGALEDLIKAKLAPKKEALEPEQLLSSLREKHRNFQTLKERGLLHASDLPVEKEMQKAIHDLEEILVATEEI